jgi:molybdenum cofactor cytidylyltransferase
MLAAGRSRRMDSWKMTLPLGEVVLIQASVRTALEVCSRLILVAGYRAAELRELFRGQRRVEVAANPDFEEGMFTSVRLGCRAVAGESFYLALGDMPLVAAETYRRLAGFAAAAGEGIPAVIPQFRGKKGHPLLLRREMRQRILAAPASATLREVLSDVAVLVVPVPDPNILLDVDTPEDYRRVAGP